MTLPAALLWDMDGTLIDTEPLWMASEFELIAAHGGSWSDADAHSIIGSGLRSAARVLQEHGVDLAVDEIVTTLIDRIIDHLETDGLPWRPGARALLEECLRRGVPAALVTMSWRSLADAVVAAMAADGLAGAFDVIVAGDEVPASKPDPAPYAQAAARLGVSPQDCIAVEDSPTGAASAVAAGCRTIGVPAHASLAPTPGLVVVSSLEGIDLDTLERLSHGGG